MTNKKMYNKNTKKGENQKMKSQKPNNSSLMAVCYLTCSLKGYFEYAKILISNIKSQVLCIIFCYAKIYTKVPATFLV